MNEKQEKSPEQVRFRQFMAFAWRYWKQHPYLLLGAFGLNLMARLIDVVYPLYAGKLIDALVSEQDKILVVFGIFMGLHFGFHLFRVSAFFVWNKMAVQILRKIIRDATERVQRFSTDWHANSFAGATVRKITRGKWAFDQFEDIFFMGIFPVALVLVGNTIMQFLHWPIVGAMFATGFTVYILVSVWLSSQWVGPALRASADQDTRVGAELADSVTCNATVKAFGAEAREDQKFSKVTALWQRLAYRGWQRSVMTDGVQAFIFVVHLSSVVGYAIWMWAQGMITPGEVNYIMVSFFIVGAYIRDIGMHIRNLQRAMGDMADVVVFMGLPIGVKDAPEAKDLVVESGEIVLDNITFGYENQSSRVYEDFSLTIKPGERVGLVGHSGSGKSTFVKLIQRLYDVQGGEIRIDGQNIAAVTQESLRSQISLVPQEPILFHRSLAENISYGRPGARFEEIVEAAKKAHAHDFIETLPQGYETLVGERGVKLSGGERQRVAIARAVLADCPILILDEATSSLDSISEHLIQEAVETLMEGRTTLVVAHRLSTIQNVDRILVFDQGQIVEQGTHKELVTREGGQYRALYERQTFGLIGDAHASVAA